MGTDDIFKDKRKDRSAREYNIRNLRYNTWLIICEGKETEPNYFNGLIEYLNFERKYRIKAKIVGLGKNTESLVRSVEDFFAYADKCYRNLNIPYANIIFVFDKDSFKDGQFNSAIEIGELYKKREGIKRSIVAWSNESFELWICLHFEYITSGLTRNQYYNKLTKLFRKHGILTSKQNYEDDGKNIKSIFHDIRSIGGELETAMIYSKKLLEENKDKTSCASKNPATNMHEAVTALMEIE